MGKAAKTPLERFWSKVREVDGGCWEWTGALTTSGYGQIEVSGRQIQVHRFSFENLVGPIPPGMTIHHICHNRACVNPKHLFPCSLADNVRDGKPPRGNALRKKLTREEKAVIRMLSLGYSPNSARPYGEMSAYKAKKLGILVGVLDAHGKVKPEVYR